MNVYVETNFILELAFMQEQYESCDSILARCEAAQNQLVLPSFCIAESYETLIRQVKRREQLANDLANEMRQLSRSALYRNELDAFRNASSVLAQSSQDEEQRLINVLDRVLSIADIIPLQAEIVLTATQHRGKFSLGPQDSIVLASVLYHLASASGENSCFINKNKRDFDDSDIASMLLDKQCKILFNFDSGFNYLQKNPSLTP